MPDESLADQMRREAARIREAEAERDAAIVAAERAADAVLDSDDEA